MSQMPPSMPPGGPHGLQYAPPQGGADLRTIAARQRAVMYCILADLVLAVGQFALPK
jgi:hypothetical protein